MPASTVLSNIKIADMTSVLFGPYCTQTLADMGAEVTKIETESGDTLRLLGSCSNNEKMAAMHLHVNRGKRSVVWNPKSGLGKEATHRLIQKSDVFIHNIRPDALKRLGLGFEQVKAIKQDIVYVHCLGFGTNGQYSGRPAYDDLIQSLSGMTSLAPRVDGTGVPRFVPMAIADKVSGLHAVHATLAAIMERDKTGNAVHVEVPMMECTTNFVLEDHLGDGIFDADVGEMGYERQLDPTRQPIKTLDGWIVVAPYTDDRWLRAFKLIGAAHELEDERLSDWSSRRKNRSHMQLRLELYLKQKSTAHWLSLFTDNDIPAAPVNTLEDLQHDPHLSDVGFFQKCQHPTEGPLREMQPPIRFIGVPSKDISPAPTLGQHTDEVLKELGLDKV